MSAEFDLKKSKEKIGALVPILKDVHGNLIDGFHRQKIDSNWQSVTLEYIKDPLQLALARLIVNVQRRRPEDTPNEIPEMLAKIAEMTKWTPQEIAENIGMSERWVYNYLPDVYKPSLEVNIAQRAMEGISETEEISPKEPQIKPFEFKPKPFTVWNFQGCNMEFGLPNFPGRIPGQLVANLIHFYTQKGDLVVDPMAGSGTTLDVCKIMNRNCYCYDLAPVRPEIKKWNIKQGFPEEAMQCDLIFLDPPYFRKNQGKYVTKENMATQEDSVSELDKDRFLAFMKKLAHDCYETVRPKGIVTLLISDFIADQDSILTCEYYNFFWAEGFKAINRIQCPLSTQQYAGPEVKRASERKELLNISRDLYIFKRFSNG